MTIAGVSHKLSPKLIKLSDDFSNRRFKKLHKLIHSDKRLSAKYLAEQFDYDKYEIYVASYGYCNNPKFNPLDHVKYYTYNRGYKIVDRINIQKINHTSYVYIVYEKSE